MANIRARLNRKTLAVSALGLLALVIAAVFVAGAGDNPKDNPAEQKAVARVEPFRVVRSFSGRIVAGDQVEMVSVADARIQSLHFAYGDKVEDGQLLLRLDAADVHRARSEAIIGYMRAAGDANRYADWQEGPEMQRTLRALENARYDLDESQRRTAENQRLYDRGLISRSEYEGQQGQLRQKQQALAVAEEDLQRSRRTAQGPEAQIARLQADMAGKTLGRANLAALTEIRADRAGVIVRPQTRGQAGEDSGVHAGARLSNGQVFAVVAALDGLDVTFKLDEANLSFVENGMAAQVTGAGFAGHTLQGHLQTVAGEAMAASSGGKAEFEARVRLDPLDETVQRLIRVGMTAQVSVTLYDNPAALTLPVEAVRGAGNQASVTVLAEGGQRMDRTIRLGQIGPDRVEVLSGVRAGDTVVWMR